VLISVWPLQFASQHNEPRARPTRKLVSFAVDFSAAFGRAAPKAYRKGFCANSAPRGAPCACLRLSCAHQKKFTDRT
jgi:hypothetical protein